MICLVVASLLLGLAVTRTNLDRAVERMVETMGWFISTPRNPEPRSIRLLTVLGPLAFWALLLSGAGMVAADFDQGRGLLAGELVNELTAQAELFQGIMSTASASGFILNGSNYPDATATRQMLWPLMRKAHPSIAYVFAGFHDDTCA